MWTILLAAAAAAAQPAPVYLTCTVGDAARPQTTDLALDEGMQRVTMSLPNNRVETIPALFGPAEVKFGQGIRGDSVDWTINRVDLSVRQTATFSDIIQTGKCVVKPMPAKRAF
jgi:hypothetical protein